jgi:acetylglutamate kinase
MRLVIRVAGISIDQRDDGRRFARAVADLVHDGHFLVVVHGQCAKVGRLVAEAGEGSNGNGNGNHRTECAAFAAVEHENRILATLLSQQNVTGIGLRATDAGLVQLRKQYIGNGKTGFRVEVVRMDPRWLEIISSNKGVPVLSNFSSWAGEDHLIDPDQMAAVCAASWNADALIYMTEENGVPGAHGGILRWLEIGSNSELQVEGLSDQMRGRLEACAMALRRGVRRVRILPLSNVDCLPLFYSSPIEYGTEVIATIPRF